MSGLGITQYRTDLQMIDQWNSQYPSLAWPFTLPFQCGGPDLARGYQRSCSTRRIRGTSMDVEAHPSPPVEFSKWVAGLARRVEAQVRNDWTFIPGMRNVLLRFLAITAKVLVLTYKGKDETDHEFRTRLADSVATLSEKLISGVYGEQRRAIAGTSLSCR